MVPNMLMTLFIYFSGDIQPGIFGDELQRRRVVAELHC